MCNSNLEIEKKIKKEFLRSNTKRNIRIPGGISFCDTGISCEGMPMTFSAVKMKLSSKAVCKNMQEDDAAFEGWALVLKRWGKYEKVIISWDKPDQINDEHYQRFLFRLNCFSQDFHSWFCIDKGCKVLLDDLKIKEGKKYLLNMPGKRGDDKVSETSEAKLEDSFINGDLRELLMEFSNAGSLYRQLPVGVFENKISRETRIFTGGKSAIDIWGFNKSNELLLFELKAEESKVKLGIISELYFYVCVMQKVRKQIFKYENCADYNKHLLEIQLTKKINANFLVPALHPLVDKEILKLLNEVNPDEINYGYIPIQQIKRI